MSVSALNLFDLADPEHEPLHPLRSNGTQRYLWWLYDKLSDLRPIFAGRG